MCWVVSVALMLASFGKSDVLAGYAGRLDPYAGSIERYAEEAGVPPVVFVSIILIESSGDPNAVNPRTRATGLGGIMPSDATGQDEEETERYRKIFQSRPTSEKLKDPEINLYWMARILKGLMDQYEGNAYAAIKAYSGHARSPNQLFEDKYWNKLVKLVGELEMYGAEEALGATNTW